MYMSLCFWWDEKRGGRESFHALYSMSLKRQSFSLIQQGGFLCKKNEIKEKWKCVHREES